MSRRLNFALAATIGGSLLAAAMGPSEAQPATADSLLHSLVAAIPSDFNGIKGTAYRRATDDPDDRRWRATVAVPYAGLSCDVYYEIGRVDGDSHTVYCLAYDLSQASADNLYQAFVAAAKKQVPSWQASLTNDRTWLKMDFRNPRVYWQSVSVVEFKPTGIGDTYSFQLAVNSCCKPAF